MNVLICDDERRDLQMVRLHVEQFGKDQQIDVSIYTLWNPKSSTEIMAMAEKHEMDVAFLDIDMPHISGDAIASALTEKYPSIQIIFLRTGARWFMICSNTNHSGLFRRRNRGRLIRH